MKLRTVPIPMVHNSNLDQVFIQRDGDGSRSLPGNGLGLALVKAIVTSYGGSVECESTPGEWTVFAVTGLS